MNASNEWSFGRFRLKPPIDFNGMDVLAATWQPGGLMDYLAYIPVSSIPEGGAWVDLQHITNLPNLMWQGLTKKDDRVTGYQLMGYYTEAGTLVETDVGWSVDDVGGGNAYIVPTYGEQPVTPVGIIVSVSRCPVVLTIKDIPNVV